MRGSSRIGRAEHFAADFGVGFDGRGRAQHVDEDIRRAASTPTRRTEFADGPCGRAAHDGVFVREGVERHVEQRRVGRVADRDEDVSEEDGQPMRPTAEVANVSANPDSPSAAQRRRGTPCNAVFGMNGSFGPRWAKRFQGHTS
jgi:hypothetical protein